MNTLLAGPWLGEFGWEVAVWVPLVRRYSRSFDRTIVICRDGHEYLYEDFAESFEYYDKKGLPDRWLLNGEKVGIPQSIIDKYPEATLCRPREKKCMTWPREYFMYGQEDSQDVESYRIVFHARAETKYGQESWNYPVSWYVKMLEILKIDPRDCASIGTKKGAFLVPGTQDLRGSILKRTCHVLASSCVCVGSSSGAMHLAHMCGSKIVVITGDKWQKQIGGTNKDRYYKIWRAWDTPVKVLDNDNWKPSPEKVAKAVGKMLCA